MLRMLLLVSLVLLTSCAASPRQQPIGAELVQTCPEQRAEICTTIYAPVCAFTADKQRKQYPSACNACADVQVSGYISGACPE